MLTGKALIVILLTIGAVVFLHVAVYYRMVRRTSWYRGTIKGFQRVSKRIRNPWESEDDDLAELARLTAKIRGEGNEDEEQLEDEEE